MKQGARRQEQNEIKRRAAQGETAKEISNSMRIGVKVVRGFMGLDESEEIDDGLSGKTKAELMLILDADNIEYSQSSTKAELIDLINEEE